MKPATSLLFVAAASLSAFSFQPARAENEKGEAFSDPKDAGVDYAIQGEYTGDNCAAQVIAMGGGKFHILGWSHGLPGQSPDAEKKIEVNAERTGDQTTAAFNENGWKGSLGNGKLTGTDTDGKTWELTRIVRQSPTLGEKPPADSIVLFDGTNADAWDGGKVDDRHFLEGGTKSKQKFQNFHLHVEFMTPFKPYARGQERGNSGVYLQDRYEIQVLDSFGTKGDAGDCGAVYGQYPPKLNMSFPPLTWQTYDVDFTAAKFDADGKRTDNARATIKQNGVLIQDNVAIKGSTGGGQKETPEPGPFQLQYHGNPVFFKNIWVVEKK